MLFSKKREEFTQSIRRHKRERDFAIKRIVSLSVESLKQLILQNDHKSQLTLINISARSEEQSQLIREQGGIEYFYNLFKNADSLDQKENGIWGLANLSTTQTARNWLIKQGILEELIEQLHRVRKVELQISRLWLMGILVQEIEEEASCDLINRLLTIFKYHMIKSNNASVQEECLVGLYYSLKNMNNYDQIELIQICFDSFKQGHSYWPLRIIQFIINDDKEQIELMDKCDLIHILLPLTSQIKCQNYCLILLQYYSLYYTDKILNNNEICQFISLSLRNCKLIKQSLIVVFNILFKGDTNQMKLALEKLDLQENFIFILKTNEEYIKIFYIIAQIKIIFPQIFKELIQYLEPFAFSSNTKVAQKVQKLLDS